MLKSSALALDTAPAAENAPTLAMNFYSIMQMRSLQLEQARLNRQVRSGQTIMSMLSYPATERLAINSDCVVGSLLLDRERNIVALIIWNMPQLDETRTSSDLAYQPAGGTGQRRDLPPRRR